MNSGSGGSDRLLVPSPDGGEEVRHVDALAAHFDHPGVLEHAPGGGPAGGFFFEAKEIVSRVRGQKKGQGCLPAFDEILEVVAPLDACLRLVLQLWDWLTDDIG